MGTIGQADRFFVEVLFHAHSHSSGTFAISPGG